MDVGVYKGEGRCGNGRGGGQQFGVDGAPKVESNRG